MPKIMRASWDQCYYFKKYFRRKIGRKYWRFLLKLPLVFGKKNQKKIQKKAIFAANWQKSQKIVFITSTPGRRSLNDQFKLTLPESRHQNNTEILPALYTCMHGCVYLMSAIYTEFIFD
jgi:hypothetical protein